MTDFLDVASIADVPPGAQHSVLIGTTRLLLCHEAATGRVWAMQDRCPHAFQSLAGGVVRHGTIQCPKHGACFDLATGQPNNAVTTRPLAVHATRVHEGRILISMQPV